MDCVDWGSAAMSQLRNGTRRAIGARAIASRDRTISEMILQRQTPLPLRHRPNRQPDGNSDDPRQCLAHDTATCGGAWVQGEDRPSDVPRGQYHRLSRSERCSRNAQATIELAMRSCPMRPSELPFEDGQPRLTGAGRHVPYPATGDLCSSGKISPQHHPTDWLNSFRLRLT